jgi:hypothetical protein
VIFFSAFSAATAQTSVVSSRADMSEASVKAAYLYKFLNYVEWPQVVFAQPDSPYVIAVMNADEIADELQRFVTGRHLNNRSLVVKKLRPGNALEGVHVLFIGAAEQARQPQLLKQLQSLPVLTVTESVDALSQGSMINFRLIDDRVRFEISLEPVEKSGLKLNSRLLTVAITVNKGTQQ